MQKFGKKFGNLAEIWKFLEYLEEIKIWKTIWKFKNIFGNLEKKLETLKKFGNLVYIWKQFGNLENI